MMHDELRFRTCIDRIMSDISLRSRMDFLMALSAFKIEVCRASHALDAYIPSIGRMYKSFGWGGQDPGLHTCIDRVEGRGDWRSNQSVRRCHVPEKEQNYGLDRCGRRTP